MRKIVLIMLAVALAILIVTSKQCYGENVRVYMAWYPFVGYVPFITAVEKGFYAKKGITVEIIPAGLGGTIDSLMMVSTEKVEFSVVSAAHLMAAAEKGAKLTSVMSFYEKVPTVIYYKKSRIKEPKDIKTILVTPKTTKGMVAQIFLKKNGLDGKVKEIVAHNAGRNIEINLLQNDKIDAVPSQLFETKVYYKEIFGDDLGYFSVSNYDVKLVYLVIAVNNNFLNKNEDLVRRFVSATIEGYKYSLSHVDECIGFLEKRYPEVVKLKYRETYSKTKNYISTPLGYTFEKNWDGMKEELKGVGFIEGSVDPKTLFTNRFIK